MADPESTRRWERRISIITMVIQVAAVGLSFVLAAALHKAQVENRRLRQDIEQEASERRSLIQRIEAIEARQPVAEPAAIDPVGVSSPTR